jgi:putative membrane protein
MASSAASGHRPYAVLRCALLIVATTGLPAFAQRIADPARTPDAPFVAKAADAAATDGELAAIAVQRASTAEVKAIARRILDSRRTIGRDLAAMAGTRQIAGPTRPAATQTGKPARDLRARPAAAFDAAFVALMIANGEAAVALFEAESRDGRDDEIKDWAARQLPALREQLTAVRALRLRPGGTQPPGRAISHRSVSSWMELGRACQLGHPHLTRDRDRLHAAAARFHRRGTNEEADPRSL